MTALAVIVFEIEAIRYFVAEVAGRYRFRSENPKPPDQITRLSLTTAAEIPGTGALCRDNPEATIDLILSILANESGT